MKCKHEKEYKIYNIQHMIENYTESYEYNIQNIKSSIGAFCSNILREPLV